MAVGLSSQPVELYAAPRWKQLLNFLFQIHKSPEIYVCILTMDRVSILRRCIEALLPGLSKISATTRVLVLDQNSHDDTKVYLSNLKQKLNDQLIILSSPVNLGCAGGRRALSEFIMARGMQASDCILFLDDDVIATSENWLAQLTDPIVRGSAHITGYEGWKVTEDYYTAPTPDYDYVGGGHCAIRGEVFLSGCQFDERFNPNYWEDVDFCLQAKAKKFRVLEVPDVALFHEAHGGNVDAMLQSRTAFVEKWPPERLAAVRGQVILID